jgi:hypothetical protein
MKSPSEYLEQATKNDALATRPPDHLRRVVTSISDLKARQAAKVREIGEALVTAGYDNLDAQAAVLGLSRSTTWTIIRGTHKSSGLSATVLNRMLSAPDLHPLVRRKVLEYVEEKYAGRYGNTRDCLQRFNQRLGGGATKSSSVPQPRVQL